MHYAFWQDEVGSARVIYQPTPRSAVAQVVRRESTPPAFYMTAWTVNRAATAATSHRWARSLRVLSLAFSLGTTVLTFLLACEFLPLWAAGLAGLIVSFGSVLVLHGAELRAYSLFAFVCVLFAFVLSRAITRPRRAHLAALAGTVALGSLTHYFFLLTLAAGAVWLVSSALERAVVRRVSVALAVGLVPLAAWSPFWLRQYQHHVYGTSPTFNVGRLLAAVPVLFAPQAIVNDIGHAGQAGVFISVVASAVALLRLPSEGRLCALLVLLPLVVTAAVAALGERVLNARNLIGIAPFAAIALSWACASLPWRRGSQAAAVLVGVLVVASYALGLVTLGRTPYDRIAQEVTSQGFRHDEPLVWFGPWGGTIPVGWYLTTDMPSARWPRFVVAKPTHGDCSGVEVIARNRTGRRWLDQHRAEILARTTTPSYGDVQEGRRHHDVVVVRLGWSPGILDRAAEASAVLFRRADALSPCLSR